MDHQKMTRQMMQLNKTSFDNSFEAMNMACEQNKKMADEFLSQAEWIPEEGKRAYQEWMSAVSSGASDFKKIVDENYRKVEGYFDQK